MMTGSPPPGFLMGLVRNFRRHPVRWSLGLAGLVLAGMLALRAGEAVLTKEACGGIAGLDIVAAATEDEVGFVSCTAETYRDCDVMLNPGFEGGFRRTGVTVPTESARYHALDDFATQNGQRFDPKRFHLREAHLRCRNAQNQTAEFALVF